ncbi:MAG: hypothetical protein GAK29_03203 [Acinetobacter bereziniae]|uniref:Uncharacterized protein n=1 Tax=Acinetobacter bereziniae TaxID=106648 RepID=A0A833UTA1_ACIBZ|nr:MAG: hypothetical protein GAK29_03203 [Acinetobacter bereziniae]
MANVSYVCVNIFIKPIKKTKTLGKAFFYETFPIFINLVKLKSFGKDRVKQEEEFDVLLSIFGDVIRTKGNWR